MGMSGDLEAAVAAGATCVRIGTAIFGETASNDQHRIHRRRQHGAQPHRRPARARLACRQIVVADPLPAQLDALRAQYAVRVTDDNAAAARDADVVVLAVKPQEMRQAAEGIRTAIADKRPLLISVAAGIRASDIQRWLPAAFRSCARCPTALPCRAAG